jgi:DNA (cytosine-5)-methyltransferase 1
MKHISLFSGIGGFDLAAQWAGWDNLASCEINPFGRRHLAYYWPEAYHHDDIKTLTGEIIEHEAQKRYGSDWRADGVILSGGFPCQPYSLAGKRLGKEDERHLWPEMCRVIREIKPDWIVGENVFGLINWSHGLVFNEVQTDLETQGYEVQAFVLPACAADAPHRRDRVWIVAHRDNNGCNSPKNGQSMGEGNDSNKTGQNKAVKPSGRSIQSAEITTNAANIGQKQPWNTRERRSGLEDSHSDASRNDANANDKGLQGSEKHGGAGGGGPERNKQPERLFRTDWKDFPTQSPVCSRDDGLSTKLDGITFSKWRNESIKAAGNAIVPQIAYRIFQTINIFTHGTQSTNRPEQQHAGKVTRTETGHPSGE